MSQSCETNGFTDSLVAEDHSSWLFCGFLVHSDKNDKKQSKPHL